MDFLQLKDIVSIKSFNILHELINKPRAELYLENYTNLDDNVNTAFDPYDNDILQIDDVTVDDMIFIKDIDVIYAYDKTLISNNSQSLGSINSLVIYMRYDDVPSEILETKSAVMVKFNNIEYNASDFQNSYDIIIQATLNR